MRLIPITAILALATCALATPGLAQETARPPALANAETCLRDNVVSAVRISSGATDAADFLLTYLCAEQVSTALKYQRNIAALISAKAMFAGMATISATSSGNEPADADAIAAADGVDDTDGLDMSHMTKLYDGASVDPVSGELVTVSDPANPMSGMLQAQMAASNYLMSSEPPVFLRTLAGRLVLDARR